MSEEEEQEALNPEKLLGVYEGGRNQITGGVIENFDFLIFRLILYVIQNFA